ncbi:hypothetical protein BGW36DRAFT_460728 [Talaromyces proteolyticus]|uniref:Zn(2)-C6 fungal-type domain-containing protein n=1 Tax=Talaromyces proteolyticus TaxID=1131652 RepID=A0AAD4KU93_9EURO|nr:uncharacterized protein BGW36DRAFT_460728 [Talaromyces proteolyticus]KAH8698905.1 hypothetical protein BGW36DRAFT_460728 [Talaromyces proteolyticus]
MNRARRPGRAVKACTNCRQQKLRCDASENLTQSCSRCRKMHLECIVLSSFKRVKKKTKAELQREVDLLRQQMAMGSHIEPVIEDPQMQTSVEETVPTSVSLLSGSLPPVTEIVERSPSQSTSGQSERYGHNMIGSTLDGSTCDFQLDDLSDTGSTTTPQALNSYEVDAQKIDDCFALYFTKYAPLLPILDPRLSPNMYFSRSPLLFWTIVAIGSRRYEKDPTLLTRLAPSIQNIALLSLSMRETVIELIQSLLLLSIWPFPFNSANKAMVHIFSGAAVNLAQQIGLHVCGVGQDFARVKLIPNEAEKAYRAQLWEYCLMINQSSSYADGFIPSVLPIVENNGSHQTDQLLSPELKYCKQIHQVALNATHLIQRAGITQPNNCNSGHLHSLIELSDRELSRLSPLTSPNNMGNIYYSCARLHVRAFCFFCDQGPENFTPILSVYAAALETINAVTAADNLATICTFYVHRMLMLAALSILRILRSDLYRSVVDAKAGENAYFNTIRFLRQMSIAHDDLSARGADILAQLWASDAIFRRSDGTRDSLLLRIRSRLTMSAVYDCYWWWREEFAGLSSPFNENYDKDLEHSGQDLSFFGTTFDDFAEFSLSPAFDSRLLDRSIAGATFLAPTPVS